MGSADCINASAASVLFPPEQVEELRNLLAQTPENFGMNYSRWYLALIQKGCHWLRGYSLSGIWRVLGSLHLKYKRGQQHLHSPDPEYEEKQVHAQACVQQAREKPQTTATLYLDEFSYYRWPTVAPAYASSGRLQPPAHLKPRFNTRERLIVALDVFSGRLVYRQRAHIDLSQLVAFMADIRRAYPQVPAIHVIQDNWHNVHFHPRQIEAATQLGIYLAPLPVYAPWLNPVEKVGRKLRQEIIHMHRQGDDWDHLKQRVSNFLDQFAFGSSELLSILYRKSKVALVHSQANIQENHVSARFGREYEVNPQGIAPSLGCLTIRRGPAGFLGINLVHPRSMPQHVNSI